MVNYHYRIQFILSQKHSVNKPVLDLISTLFGSSKPLVVRNTQYDLILNGLKACQPVIDYFDHFHLISKKRISYCTWKVIYYA